MKPKEVYRKHRKATQVKVDKPTKVACESCITKFKKKHGRNPTSQEKQNFGQERIGCECENCYRESLCEFAWIAPIKDYQTMTQAVWLAGF